MSKQNKKSKTNEASLPAFAASLNQHTAQMNELSAASGAAPAPTAAASSADMSTPVRAPTAAAAAASSVTTSTGSGDKKRKNIMTKPLKSVNGGAGSQPLSNVKVKEPITPERLAELRQKLHAAIEAKRNPAWNIRGYAKVRLASLPAGGAFFQACMEDCPRSFNSDGLCKKQVVARPVPQVGAMAAGAADDESEVASTLDTIAVETEFFHSFTDATGAVHTHANPGFVPVYMLNCLWEDELDDNTRYRCIGWDDVGLQLFGCDAYELANMDEDERSERYERALTTSHVLKVVMSTKGNFLNITLKAVEPQVE